MSLATRSRESIATAVRCHQSAVYADLRGDPDAAREFEWSARLHELAAQLFSDLGLLKGES